jgi:hypothetical protein
MRIGNYQSSPCLFYCKFAVNMSSSHLLLPASGRHWWVVAVRTPLPAAHTDHGLYAPIPGDEVVFERQPAHAGKQTGSSA